MLGNSSWLANDHVNLSADFNIKDMPKNILYDIEYTVWHRIYCIP